MQIIAPPLVPELDVADLERSLAVYVGVLGFTCALQRDEERFAYLIREGAHLMLEEAAERGRRFSLAPLEFPFGRGLNLQIKVANVDALYADTLAAELNVIFPLEERWYRHDDGKVGNRQFVVADPDGYLLRFFKDLGRSLP